MTMTDLIASIDVEIARLQQARALLAGSSRKPATKSPKAKARRKLSAAGRKRIADAQRKRWAALKRAAAKTA